MNIQEKFDKYLAATSPFPLKLEIVKAEGIYMYDKDNNKIIDLISGLSVNNIGHRHPKVIKAILDQLDKYLHIIPYGEFVQEPQVLLSEKLCRLMNNNINQFFFVNSGTEAIEATMKLAKRYTRKRKIISFKNAYHGSTQGSLSLSSNQLKKEKFLPLLPDIYHIEFNNIAELQLIDNDTACVIIEPVQSDAGVRIPSMDFMKLLRKRCDETKALLIVDEIQTGFGRCGEIFAYKIFDIEPDIICMAKALGGGMHLGCFGANEKIMKSLSFDPILGHITTFGGHPISCVSAIANIDVISNDIDMDEVKRKGRMFKTLLSSHRLIKEIRQIGLMLAIDMEDEQIVKKTVDKCLENGLLTFYFLSCPSSFRLAPPLIINDDEIEYSCTIILKVLDEINNI